jgi:hypothetical protein
MFGTEKEINIVGSKWNYIALFLHVFGLFFVLSAVLNR